MANNILNTPIINNPLIMIAHDNTKHVLNMCLYMQISCKTIKLKSIKKNVKNYQIVALVSKQGQLRQWMENYLNLWEKLYNNCEKFYIL